MHHRDTSNLPAWAKLVNRSWLVRGGLDATTDAWLTHLEQTDPARLLASCEIARALCRGPDRTIDPKPWFYAGLFSLATAEEARHYLTNHKFTAAATPALAQDDALHVWASGLGPVSRDLLERLRAAVRALASQHLPSEPLAESGHCCPPEESGHCCPPEEGGPYCPPEESGHCCPPAHET